MADAGWRYGRPAETDTGILRVLTDYGSQGGQLYGARRWAENPLTLTHVRWQGTSGAFAEAFRHPNLDDNGSDAERQIWVQLALAVPATYGPPPGSEAPWLPLAVPREKAMEWGQVLRQAQLTHQSQGHHSYGGGAFSRPRMPAVGADMPRRPTGSFAPPGPTGSHSLPGYTGYALPRPSAPSGPMSVDMEPTLQFSATAGGPPSVSDEERQLSGSWQRGRLEMPEIVVVPCVDVELPPTIDGIASSDYRRDFARDVAMHFTRAARAIPQVREIRGWMRGDRMVLAARFVVALGNRPPSRAEMDGAAQILADNLAQRTLPYVRLSFADPGEWIQGAPLPE
ncbi:MAG: hypothetical protein ACRDHP_13405 [Ktedonobacterales bacterium]